MPVNNLKTLLDKQKIRYESLMHSPAFTAQEIAASAHISGKQLAKIVIIHLKTDDKLAMVVLPATQNINFMKLKEALGFEADLASESEFKNKFPGCEVGAMPPFGNLYDMPVYLSKTLHDQKELYCNAGSHAELMHLSVKDFEKIVHPEVIGV